MGAALPTILRFSTLCQMVIRLLSSVSDHISGWNPLVGNDVVGQSAVPHKLLYGTAERNRRTG